MQRKIRENHKICLSSSFISGSSLSAEKVTQYYILSHYHQKIIICNEPAPYAS